MTSPARRSLLAIVALAGVFGSILPAAVVAAPTAITAPASAARPADRLNIVEVRVFGSSVNGGELVAYRVGTPGGRVVLIIGNVHGDEPKGTEITRRLRMSAVPAGVDLWVVDTINPDGMAAGTRQNANGVDLNRNFSYDWGYIPPSTTNRQYSGEAPADQPEAKALQALVEQLQPQITIFYHQDANRISLGGRRKEIPQTYAALVGQTTGSTPCTAGCTGTAGSFVNHTVPEGTSFLVELPNSSVVTPTMIERHVQAVLAVVTL